MSPERIVLLGTGTCDLTRGPAASAVLLEVAGTRLVFDFGRGTATRLVELGLRQDDLQHVVLSHFHTDHWSDLLPYLQAASHAPADPRQVDLTIHSTPKVIAKLETLLALFGPDELIVRKRFQVRLQAITGSRLEIDGCGFEYCPLPPAGNHGLRFSSAGGQVCALTGDSHFHQAEIDFLRGADLAVIDAGHPSDDEIVSLAVATQVPEIVCSHLYRDLDLDELGGRAAERGYRGRLSVGRDLQTFAL